MTTIDPFERELPGAITDLADAQTPDYFVDLLGRTARTRQRPPWAFPGRWFPTMPALTARPALTIVAIAIVAILGGAFIVNRSNQNVGVPPASSTPVPTATPYPSPLPMPSAIVGGWLAPLRPSPIVQGPTSVIQFGGFADNPNAFAIDTTAEPAAISDVREIAPGLIALTSIGSLGGCTIGDVGHYRWSTTADGAWLTMAAVDDACAGRAAVAPGTWVRSGAHDSHGGSLVQANFAPFFSFTGPASDWKGSGPLPGAMAANSGARTFQVWQDPDGFVDPCDADKGRVALAPGIDPFMKYMTDDSGFTVTNQRETTIDGHRAVAFDFEKKASIQAPCWNKEDGTPAVLEWAAHADPGGWWNLHFGDHDKVLVTEVAGHTIVFEVWNDKGVDQATLDSIRFLDALPTPPTS